MPVVHAEWLQRSCETGELECEAPYLLGPLQGLTISLSGLGFDRQRIGELVTACGGTLIGGLTQDCTQANYAWCHGQQPFYYPDASLPPAGTSSC